MKMILTKEIASCKCLQFLMSQARKPRDKKQIHHWTSNPIPANVLWFVLNNSISMVSPANTVGCNYTHESLSDQHYKISRYTNYSTKYFSPWFSDFCPLHIYYFHIN